VGGSASVATVRAATVGSSGDGSASGAVGVVASARAEALGRVGRGPLKPSGLHY
jgi:hypothetical protein